MIILKIQGLLLHEDYYNDFIFGARHFLTPFFMVEKCILGKSIVICTPLLNHEIAGIGKTILNILKREQIYFVYLIEIVHRYY